MCIAGSLEVLIILVVLLVQRRHPAPVNEGMPAGGSFGLADEEVLGPEALGDPGKGEDALNLSLHEATRVYGVKDTEIILEQGAKVRAFQEVTLSKAKWVLVEFEQEGTRCAGWISSRSIAWPSQAAAFDIRTEPAEETDIESEAVRGPYKGPGLGLTSTEVVGALQGHFDELLTGVPGWGEGKMVSRSKDGGCLLVLTRAGDSLQEVLLSLGSQNEAILDDLRRCIEAHCPEEAERLAAAVQSGQSATFLCEGTCSMDVMHGSGNAWILLTPP